MSCGHRIRRRPSRRPPLPIPRRSAPRSSSRCTVAGALPFAGHRPAADHQVAGGQHVGPHPARQRIEHRRIARPGEAPHAVDGQDGHRARVGVDHRRGGRPRPAGTAPRTPCRRRPRPDRAASRPAPRSRQRRRRGGQPSRRSVDDRGGTRQRVPRHRQRHPFLPVAQHAEPGTSRIVDSTNASPGPVAISAGTTTATAASTSSGTAAGRRTTTGSPAATMPSRTTVATTAKSVVREAGTASPFQMPPRPARLPSVPEPGFGARGERVHTCRPATTTANRATIAAVSHGSAASTAAPRPIAATPPPRPAVARREHARQRDRRRQHQPGRRQPGQRDPEHQRPHAGPAPAPMRAAAARRRHPRQAAVADEQAPVPLQKAFGDIRIPDRERHRHELAGQPGLRQHGRPTRRAAPHPASHSPRTSSSFDHHAAVDTVDASATAKSWGSARGAASDSPSAASVR